MTPEETLEELRAAKAAIAEAKAAFNGGFPGNRPVISDIAEAELRRGGIERVIASGECPGCATVLVAWLLSIAAHNKRSRELTEAKRLAGYDEAVEAAREALAKDPANAELAAELSE